MQIDTSSNTERRAFSIHPSIIKTLINEQAGTLAKAVAELIMNGIDAGASTLEMEISDGGDFVLRDDGKGFTSRDEIEQFFETFGHPHSEGDAYYGRFRIGRGQIMSFAKTVWRSGKFEMRVDLEGDGQFFGYELIEHAQEAPGCTISGTIYNNESWETKRSLIGSNDVDWDSESELAALVRYVPIPVLVNGAQISQPPEQQKWDAEDEHAWYQFDRKGAALKVFNRGVHVCDIPARNHGVGGIITTKKPLQLNMARNSVLKHRCETWWAIEQAIINRFTLQLGRVTRLNDAEAGKLLHDLLFTEGRIPWEIREKITKTRFIPNVFGELRSPNDIITQERFTLYSGECMGIAERVQREGHAVVIMPEFMKRAQAAISEDNALRVIQQLRNRLGIARDLPCTFIPFDQFAAELSDTAAFIPDEELTQEEALVMKLLRDLNRHIAVITNGNTCTTRKLLVGVSDQMEGWTNGSTFIAINRHALKWIRGQHHRGSPARLIALLVHEYAHPDTSQGEHHHDHEFYLRYHNATMHPEFGLVIDKLFRKYITGIAKLQVVPSGEHRAHLSALSRDAAKLRAKGRN